MGLAACDAMVPTESSTGSRPGVTDDLGVTRRAIGEPQDGFPNWDERVIHLWTNRARSDPQTELAGCTGCTESACYGPEPPLRWSYQLNRAARFHSANQTSCNKMTHNSSCTLVPDIGTAYDPGDCMGEAECACIGGGPPCACDAPTPCTETWSRIGMFGASGSGENVAGGGPGAPLNEFYAWLFENYDQTTCDFDYGPPTNGHRWNILKNGGPGLGVGCAGSYCTQDFGGPAEAAHKLVVGVHHPKSGTVDFRAHWYDQAGGPPQQAMVNLAGECYAMTKERGVDDFNATYLLPSQAISGCQRYFFVFKDSAGAFVTYPESGSFGIGCGDDYDPLTRPTTGASCDCTPACNGVECGPDGCGSVCPPGCGLYEGCQSGSCVCTNLDCDGACCAPAEICFEAACCLPACAGRECGTDGCGGSCGTCPGDLGCDPTGTCACLGGLDQCGNACVNLDSDSSHCGACDNACVPPEVCALGICAETCPPGYEDCGGSCADLATDPTHCGECFHACTADATCQEGVCVCTGGLIDCPGVGCTDVSSDPDNCGACGVSCPNCTDGRCPQEDAAVDAPAIPDAGGGSAATGEMLAGTCGCAASEPGTGLPGLLLMVLLAAALPRRRRP